MRIKPLKEAILLCRDARVTPFIWGHRGLGKSQITSQTADDNKMGFSDWRLSQSEASDLRGLPLADRETMTTRFLPPADLPRGGMTWGEYMAEMELFDVLKANVTSAQLEEILRTDPAVVENPTAIIAILTGLERFAEADEVARKRTKLQPMLNEGILFLDEVNRAQDDVIQAAFQLVLERRLGQYTLPQGWCVVCAGNYMEGYMTNGFTDPAFINRFAHLDLSGGDLTLEEWVGYMSEKHGGAAAGIIEFASQNTKHLDGDIKGEKGFTIQPSRRSWEAIVRVEQAFAENEAKFSQEARTSVIAGLIGYELGIAYSRYSCPVRPKEMIAKGVDHFKTQLKTLSRQQMQGLMWGVASFLKGKVSDDKNAKVALDFARFLAGDGKDKDIAVAFCNMMVGGNNFKARAALVSNPAVSDLIQKFRTQGAKRTFADRLAEDKSLQALMSATAWGKE